MLKKIAVNLILIFSTTLFVQAQSKFTVSGTVKEKSSGETLIGVNVVVAEKPNVGVTTNEYGFYSISLPQGNYTLRFSYIGYEQELVPVKLNSNIKVNMNLSEGISLQEVVVSAKKADDNLTNAAMGTEVLNMKIATKVPVLFGEKDLVKTIQLMPGLKSNGEGSNGFSVRGGASDQNLILLDEAPVYNASHLLGIFSTFNSDAIKDATIIKGNSPAQYGGRLSSVLDVKMKEGNNRNYQMNGGIGLLTSRLTLEGPIQKEKSSFIISGRRTYADLFARLSSDFKDVKLYFYDLNAKANFAINDKNKLYVSGYLGKDVLAASNLFGSNWGNATGTLRWNSLLSSKLFSNTSFIYSNYDFNVGFKSDVSEINFNSNIKDINLKQDFSFYLNSKNTIRFGFNLVHHTITPTKAEGTDIVSNKKSRKGLENSMYVSNSFEVSEKINIDYGFRFSSYSILGGDTYNIYKDNELVESIELAKGKTGKSYYNLEPRASLNYRLSQTASLKMGYARNTQNLHLMSNSTGGSPTDQWIGNSYNIKPEIAEQVSFGFSKNFNNNKFEFNAETYYKTMQHQIDYRDGADINTVPDIESELLFGKGRAYGLEVLFRKNTGRFTGWVGYTLSKTERKINGINSNNWYDAKNDRTHDLTMVGIYNLTPRWTLSGTFLYTTGNAVTFPTGKYVLNDMVIYQYDRRNADRMPATHRLDISATYERPSKGKYQSSWSFGLYNVYGRKNPYSIDFKENKNNPQKIDAVQTSLFQWIPSVTYNFKF
ncbi:MAG: TonB-dependent receptor [Bacteroidetes bacterium]|nr:TonB-dependent receptor [Bacteroidota bacterium]